MDLEVLNAVEERLEQDFSQFQVSTGTTVPTPVRAFVREVVLESLELRVPEWQQRGQNPGVAINSAIIANEVSKSLKRILADADTYDPPGPAQKRIMVVGVLRKIHEHFCGVFPFCR